MNTPGDPGRHTGGRIGAPDAAAGARRTGGGRVILLHLRVGVMNELQYRANFVIQLLQSLVAIGTGLVVLSLIFDRTDQLDGWTHPQLLIVMGIFTLVSGVIGFAIEPNMGRVMGDIERGTFDYVLTKPVDSQLLASCREFRIWRLTDAIVGLVVLGWGLSGLDVDLGARDVAGFVVTLVAGIVLIYCLWLVLTAGAFWVVRMDQVQELFTGLYRAGQYPVTVYPVWLKLMLTYLVPLGFAITVPSESLTGRLTVSRFAITLGFVVVAFVATRWFWRRGTRRYSGASA
ncbi:MAG TPA: ABC-2 family transporter protein [Ilumatobacter sp.]